MMSDRWRGIISYSVSDLTKIYSESEFMVPYTYVRYICEKYNFDLKEVLSRRKFLDKLAASLFAPKQERIRVYALNLRKQKESRLKKVMNSIPSALFNN